MTPRLGDLLSGEGFALEGAGATTQIRGVCLDSRKIRAGWLFAALPGTRTDGARFIEDAWRNGAAAALVAPHTRVRPPPGCALVRDQDPARRYALIAARFYRRQPTTMVAVTGTAGKTSCVENLRRLWQGLGHEAASFGTLGCISADTQASGVSLTTPEAGALHAALAACAKTGVTHAALEASSHGLDQRRLDGAQLAGAMFTGLGRDHLDYHADTDAYFAAKLRLVRALLPANAPVLAWSAAEQAQAFLTEARAHGCRAIAVGGQGDALALAGLARDPKDKTLIARVAWQGKTLTLPTRLFAPFQVANVLLSAAMAIALGEDAEAVLAACATIPAPPGRMEAIASLDADAPQVFVDYAHDADSLAAALGAARGVASGRLGVVFGCGGERDKGKRALMGAQAAALADVVVITDDNPRTEDAARIRADIRHAAPDAQEIADRSQAIEALINTLGAGDVVLIAGKGHETTQENAEGRKQFSDKGAAQDALRARHNKRATP